MFTIGKNTENTEKPGNPPQKIKAGENQPVGHNPTTATLNSLLELNAELGTNNNLPPISQNQQATAVNELQNMAANPNAGQQLSNFFSSQTVQEARNSLTGLIKVVGYASVAALLLSLSVSGWALPFGLATILPGGLAGMSPLFTGPIGSIAAVSAKLLMGSAGGVALVRGANNSIKTLSSFGQAAKGLFNFTKNKKQNNPVNLPQNQQAEPISNQKPQSPVAPNVIQKETIEAKTRRLLQNPDNLVNIRRSDGQIISGVILEQKSESVVVGFLQNDIFYTKEIKYLLFYQLNPPKKEKSIVSEIEPQETTSILKNLNLVGEFKVNEKGGYDPKGKRKLTPELIKKYDLGPKFKLILPDNQKMLASRPFEVEGRVVFLGFVKQLDGRYTIRTWYKSNSAGVYRLLPLTIGEKGSWAQVGHFNKGFNEASLNLPHLLQKPLEEIASKNPVVIPEETDLALLFRGNARIAPAPVTNITYVKYVESQPVSIPGLPPTLKNGKISLPEPSSVKITNPDLEPDFSTLPIDQYEANGPLFGQYTVSCFHSKNKELVYSMGHAQIDGQKQVWVCGIEVANSPINQTGVRNKWIDGGALTVPLYEYTIQADGYGDDEAKRPKSHYISMWKNYLSQISYIQEFVAKDF